MIDYQKLKEAHELMLILSNNNGCSLRLTFCDGKFWKYFLQINDKKDIFEFNCIDELITKLKEQTKPKPKYELGEIVWLFNHECNEIDCFKIDAISTKTLRYSGECCNSDFVYEEIPEKDLYPSREALIDAQIEYWQSLKEPVKPEDMRPKFEGEVKGFNHCEHDYDALRDDCGYKFLRHINGTSYYVSHKDNDVYCACGLPADFPHNCKCRKCGAGKIMPCEHEPTTEYYLAYPYKKPNKCKKCGEFYR